MRMMLRVSFEVEAANKAIRDGSLPKMMQSVMEELKPEASYFMTDRGKRTGLIFFDLKDSSDLPSIAEPFFQNLHAAVEFRPVMNADDLRSGLEKLAKKKF